MPLISNFQIRFSNLCIFLFFYSTMFSSVSAEEMNYLNMNAFKGTGDLIIDKNVLKVKAKSKSTTLKQTVKVAKKTLYIFSGWIKSHAVVSIRISTPGRNTKFISYNQQGSWQKITGLFNSKSACSCSFQVIVKKLKMSGSPSALLKDFTFRKVKSLPLPSRNLQVNGTTIIDKNDKKDLYIVIPSIKQKKYFRYAKRIQEAFKKKTNFVPEVLTDLQACQEDCPQIKPVYANANLILLGRLGINKAIWSGYNRFLCAVDAYYPGPYGYVVQTMTNVLRNYKNHIIVGSSSDDGMGKAVASFEKIIRQQCQTTKNDNIKIPFMHQIELDGNCLMDFRNDDKLWSSASPILPPFEPGYGTIRKWYQNAMGYYYTGWDSYRERCVNLSERIIAKQAYNHHYVIEFFIRSYEMIYPTKILSKELTAGLDKLIFKNYIDFQTGQDLRWMQSFSPPYESKKVVNRHQIAPWMAQCVMTDFLYYNFISKGDSKSLIDFIHGEMHSFFDGIIKNRWGENANNNITRKEETNETALAFLRYALENEKYDFCKTNAHQALAIDKLCHINGLCVQPEGKYRHDQISNVLSSYFNDGIYKWISRHIPYTISKSGPFNDRYIGLTHFYNIEPSVKEQYPSKFTGLRLVFFMPADKFHLPGIKGGLFKNYTKRANVDKALEFVAFREGFNQNDDYLTISGALLKKCLPGEVVSLWSDGVCWLNSRSDSLFEDGATPFVRNSALVTRTDVQTMTTPPFASVSTLAGMCNFKDFEFLSMNISPYMDTNWQRNVLRLGHGLFLVKDSFAAMTKAPYEIFINWKPSGSPDFKNNTWFSRLGNSSLSFTLLSDSFKIDHNVDCFKKGTLASKNYLKDSLYLRNTFSGTLNKGQNVSAYNLFQVSEDSEAIYKPELQAPERILLSPAKDDVSPIEVSFGKHHIQGIDNDAKLLMISEQRIVLVQCSKLLINGQSIYENSTAVNILLDLDKNKILIQNCITQDKQKLKTKDISKNCRDWEKLRTLVKTYLKNLKQHKAPETQAISIDGNIKNDILNKNIKAKILWKYDGFLHPERISKIKKVRDDVLDLGSVRLAKIKNAGIPRDQIAPLTDFWVSSSYENGKIPASKSKKWKKLPSPKWQPGLLTGNYGKGVPIQEAFQTIETEAKTARLVRSESIRTVPLGQRGLIFYDAQRKESIHPCAIELIDIDDDGDKDIFVYTKIPKTWPRPRRSEEAAFALLTEKGKEVFKNKIYGNLQDLKVINYTGDKKKEILMATMDSQIRAFNNRGKLIKHYNLYKMHQDFHKKHGRNNTRHPAAGYTTPFALGLWRPNAKKAYKMLISRYGQLSFIDENGKFQGVKKAAAYCTPYMLPYGIDFDKDGKEEQLCIERFRLIHIYGDKKQLVRNPGSSIFWPEVYNTSVIQLPAAACSGTYPDTVYIFEPLKWAGGNRYVLIVSKTYIVIYDALHKKFIYKWTPFISIVAAAVVKDSSNSLQVIIYSEDNTLSFITWNKKLDKISNFKKVSTDGQIKNIYSEQLPNNKTLTILAGNNGIYKITDDQVVTKIINGAFYDAKPLYSDGKLKFIVASSMQGEIIKFRLD